MKLSEVDTMLNNLDACAIKDRKQTKSYREFVRVGAEDPFPVKRASTAKVSPCPNY